MRMRRRRSVTFAASDASDASCEFQGALLHNLPCARVTRGGQQLRVHVFITCPLARLLLDICFEWWRLVSYMLQ